MEQSSGHLHPAGPPLIPSLKIDQKFGTKSWGILHRENVFHGSNDASLFSSSLPVLPHEKLNFYREPKIQFVDDASSKLKNSSIGMDGKDSLDDVDLQEIRLSLPSDEDELLAGIMDDFDLSELPSQVEDLEEYDIFGSGGGIELDLDPTESLNDTMSRASIGDGYAGNGFAHYGPLNGVGSVVGEHPYGEHPSRTLFVRNINSNIEDSELQALFEQYGDIRTLYTACKHRGFVMISYYDIRDARTAMHALQNKPLRRRKLDIHFSIPKDNPSDKDMNQGTLVVFNLDPLVSNDDLLQIFEAYGEVKEIRETPHRKNYRFIEFYDVRAAEAALRSLNRIDIAGKRIKLEPSRPFGARRNLMHQSNQELGEETKFYRQHMGSPITNSPPGNWAEFLRPVENGLQQPLTNNSTMGAMNHMGNNHLQGLASVLSPLRSNTVKIAPIGKDQSRIVHADHVFANDSSSPGLSFQYSRSFPDHSSGMMMNMSSNPGELSSFCPLTSNASGVGMLSGPQFLWGSPTPYSQSSQSSAWQTPPTGHSFSSNGPSHHGSLLASSRQHHHHVGSAPSGIPFDRYFDYVPESPDTSFMISEAFGIQKEVRPMTNLVARTPMNPVVPLSGFMSENGLPNFRMMPSHRFDPAFYGNAPYPVLGSLGIESQLERSHTQRIDSRSQLDSKHLYQLDLEKVVSGEDIRTTLMIKNIPNKYTSKMLIATIDKNHKGTYDFLYLPIDFKNKCNVGYAFINMVSPSHIMSFHQAFDGKKWEKFNSEKVASLAYARIQGKAALIAHFQNSSLMNEDKQHRPIVFHSEGVESDQEVLPLNGMTVCVWKQDGTLSDWDSQEKGKPLGNS